MSKNVHRAMRPSILLRPSRELRAVLERWRLDAACKDRPTLRIIKGGRQ